LREDVFLWGTEYLDPDKRAAFALFCGFASQARAIAENRGLDNAERSRALELIDAALDAPPAEPILPEDFVAPACSLAERLREFGFEVEGLHRITQACRRDATGLGNRSWGELLIYAQFAAAPYGRFLLDLHAEDQACRRSAEALSVAVFLLTRLSELGELYRGTGRIALPEDWLERAATELGRIETKKAPPALLTCVGQGLDRIEAILNVAANLPNLVRDYGLRRQCAYQFAGARQLARLLRTRDPWRTPVRLGRWRRFLVRLAGRRMAKKRGAANGD
jgi:hydroxysqualene synthase